VLGAIRARTAVAEGIRDAARFAPQVCDIEEKPIPFIDVALRAVAEYDMQGCTLEFIRHSDNVTFKVEGAGSGAYLLRLHVPVTRAMGAHGADSSAVNSAFVAGSLERGNVSIFRPIDVSRLDQTCGNNSLTKSLIIDTISVT